MLVGKAPEPSITKLGDEVFAVGKDSQTIFVNTNGDPSLKYAVKWPEAPTALGNYKVLFRVIEYFLSFNLTLFNLFFSF